MIYYRFIRTIFSIPKTNSLFTYSKAPNTSYDSFSKFIFYAAIAQFSTQLFKEKKNSNKI